MIMITAITNTNAAKQSDDKAVSFLKDNTFSIRTFVFAPPKADAKKALPEEQVRMVRAYSLVWLSFRLFKTFASHASSISAKKHFKNTHESGLNQ